MIEKQEIDKNIFKLDKYNLDKEWEQQASNVYFIGDLASEAFAKYISLKSHYVKRKAQIELDYRTGKRTIEGLSKMTEGAISSAVDADEELFLLLQEVNDMRHQADIYSNGVESLKHKKSGLEHEQQLFFAKYFSNPVNKTGTMLNDAEKDFLSEISDQME